MANNNGNVSIVCLKSGSGYRVEFVGMQTGYRKMEITNINRNTAWINSGLTVKFRVGQQVNYEDIANYFITDLLFDITTSKITEGQGDLTGTLLSSVQSAGPVGAFSVASQPVPNNGTFTLTIKFNRAVSGFVAADITFAAGASIGALTTSDNITFTGTVTTTNSAGTPVTCTVASGSYTDAASGKNGIGFTATFTRA